MHGSRLVRCPSACLCNPRAGVQADTLPRGCLCATNLPAQPCETVHACAYVLSWEGSACSGVRLMMTTPRQHQTASGSLLQLVRNH